MQDPTLVLNEYGADALRLYLINSPVVRGETLRFKKEGVFAVVKDVFLPWYNAYRFLVQNVLRLQQQSGVAFEPTKVMPSLLLLGAECPVDLPTAPGCRVSPGYTSVLLYCLLYPRFVTPVAKQSVFIFLFFFIFILVFFLLGFCLLPGASLCASGGASETVFGFAG